MEEVEADSREEALQRRHRKERKELQAKIQGMKNAVAKNDKKRRKQLTEEIAKLEAEMDERHNHELQQLNGKDHEQTQVESAANSIENLELEDTESTSELPRITKAQKRREKKAALEKERDERIAEAEIENLSGARHLESKQLALILAARQLQIKQVASDGHCMYRAVEDQLKERKSDWTISNLRSQTAEYMRKHIDDFLPFSTNPNTGDMYTPAVRYGSNNQKVCRHFWQQTTGCPGEEPEDGSVLRIRNSSRYAPFSPVPGVEEDVPPEYQEDHWTDLTIEDL